MKVANSSQGTKTARSRPLISVQRSSTVIGTRCTPCFSTHTVAPVVAASGTLCVVVRPREHLAELAVDAVVERAQLHDLAASVRTMTCAPSSASVQAYSLETGT